MIEVMVTVKFQNKNYLTNVIVDKNENCGKIKLLAEEQVIKQWG